MAKRPRKHGNSGNPGRRPSRGRAHTGARRSGASPPQAQHFLGLRCLPDGQRWELVHPPCVRERQEDLAEVQQILEAGETDIARDELLWLLEDCRDCLAAHVLLGELAEQAGDWKLARGHYGYAYQLGESAIDAASVDGRLPGELPADLPANRDFYLAAEGLVTSLLALQETPRAQAIAARVLAWDPRDPAQLASVALGRTTACGASDTADPGSVALSFVSLELPRPPDKSSTSEPLPQPDAEASPDRSNG